MRVVNWACLSLLIARCRMLCNLGGVTKVSNPSRIDQPSHVRRAPKSNVPALSSGGYWTNRERHFGMKPDTRWPHFLMSSR
jgi:hypothetical protein